MNRALPSAVIALALCWPLGAQAANLYRPGAWPALASDRLADRVGDSLTVIIDQTSAASNTAQLTSKKASQAGGQLTAGTTFDKSANLNLSGGFDGSGQNGRSDRIAAEISVVVDALLANGDLHVAGSQTLKINGEHTTIRVSGRVRRADISSDNTISSTRLADAAIDYDGTGFVANSAKAGILSRLLNVLHLP